ncbi:MAG TPA: glycosyltransferase, partial [Tepidisphaeraceae bacterium]|nr:glycosyltransferase [Tepidisphaeraceae bacterium]
ECIVVDDGSTDRTPVILGELAAKDARVKPLRIRHSGIVEALNAGVNAATGEIIARMDADDICLPFRFQKQIDYLDQHPECVAVGTEVMLVDPFGSPLWRIEVKAEHEHIDVNLLSGDGWAMFHPTTMLRKKAVLEVGGYRAQYQWAEDMDLFLRLAEVGRLANIQEVMLHYRQHFASVNRTKLEIQRHRSERVIIEAYRRRGLTMPANFQLHMTPQLTRYEQVRAWGQRALMTGNVAAARRHALAALRFEPLRYDSWSLIYHAVIPNR